MLYMDGTYLHAQTLKYPLFSQKSLYTQFLIRTDEHTLYYTKVYSAM